ncbi:MAG: VC0807 family protein [Janthinobacterium lividum]
MTLFGIPIRVRYLVAFGANVVCPWLAYQLAYPYWGSLGALIISASPVVIWMLLEGLRFRHFDALSAVVLVTLALTIVATVLDIGPGRESLRDPVISGAIGVAFLLSLLMPRPLIYYLARSTLARQSDDGHGAERFEENWRRWPALPGKLRWMTVVWGVGLIVENVLRTYISWISPQGQLQWLADTVRYGIWAALTLWTFYRRRQLRRDGERYVSGIR